jgi:Reverse transcriptase (RNA-dependent DNA polymerase)
VLIPEHPADVESADTESPTASAEFIGTDKHQGRRQSTRISHPPAKLKYYVTYHAVKYPIQKYVRYDKLSAKYQTFLTQISSDVEPKTFEETIKHKVWVDAMEGELKALNRNNTWELVKIPDGKKTMGCRWIYKTKYMSDVFVERSKARLVAKKYIQTYDIDYKKYFF